MEITSCISTTRVEVPRTMYRPVMVAFVASAGGKAESNGMIASQPN